MARRTQRYQPAASALGISQSAGVDGFNARALERLALLQLPKYLQHLPGAARERLIPSEASSILHQAVASYTLSSISSTCQMHSSSKAGLVDAVSGCSL